MAASAFAGVSGDGEEARQHLGRPVADAGGDHRLLDEAVGDLVGGAPADGGEPGLPPAPRPHGGVRPARSRRSFAAVHRPSRRHWRGRSAPVSRSRIAEGAGQPPLPRRAQRRARRARRRRAPNRRCGRSVSRTPSSATASSASFSASASAATAVRAAERFDAGLQELAAARPGAGGRPGRDRRSRPCAGPRRWPGDAGRRGSCSRA